MGFLKFYVKIHCDMLLNICHVCITNVYANGGMSRIQNAGHAAVIRP